MQGTEGSGVESRVRARPRCVVSLLLSGTEAAFYGLHLLIPRNDLAECFFPFFWQT